MSISEEEDAYVSVTRVTRSSKLPIYMYEEEDTYVCIYMRRRMHVLVTGVA